VPGKQYALIQQDGIPIEKYLARTVDGELILGCICSAIVSSCIWISGFAAPGLSHGYACMSCYICTLSSAGWVLLADSVLWLLFAADPIEPNCLGAAEPPALLPLLFHIN
jgi:hypothetical protein